MLKKCKVHWVIILTAFIVIGCSNIFDGTGDNELPPDLCYRELFYYDFHAQWTSDGRYIIYYNGRVSIYEDDGDPLIPLGQDTTYGLFCKDTEADTTYVLLKDNWAGLGGLSVSEDMQWVVFEHNYTVQKIPLSIPKMNPDEMVEVVPYNLFSGFYPDWSVDGNLIAYAVRSNPSGIYLINQDGSNKRFLHGYAYSPNFSKVGDYLFSSRSPDAEIYKEIFKVNYSTGDSIQISNFDKFELMDRVLPSEDESYFIFSAIPRKDGNYGYYIYRCNADGSNLKRITNFYSRAWDWNYETNKILYTDCHPYGTDKTNGHLWIMNPDGSHREQITFKR